MPLAFQSRAPKSAFEIIGRMILATATLAALVLLLITTLILGALQAEQDTQVPYAPAASGDGNPKAA